MDPTYRRMVNSYHHGLGKMLVLQFAAFCIAISSLSFQILPLQRPRSPLEQIAPNSNLARWAAMILTLVLVATLLAAMFLALRTGDVPTAVENVR